MADIEFSRQSRQRQILLGLFIVLVAVVLLSSMISYYFSWESDQSKLMDFADRSVTADNAASKLGATIADFFLYKFL